MASIYDRDSIFVGYRLPTVLYVLYIRTFMLKLLSLLSYKLPAGTEFAGCSLYVTL